jgi:hypothetical protein
MHSWDSLVDMPNELLNALHRYHPTAQIQVSSTHLDQAIISSEQLRRLSVSIPCSDVTNPDSLAPFEHLRNIVLRSSNLRTLEVDVYLDVNLQKAASQKAYKIESDTITRIQIPLKQVDQMPPLEELAFNARTYDFDREHCNCLLHCMDWTKLKRLILGPLNPVTFFETFTNSFPALEHLDIAYNSLEPSFFSGTPDHLKDCSRFISSLCLLKTIIIRCDVIDLTQPFWRRLAASHGERLESLSMQPRHERYMQPIWQSAMPEFLSHFSVLKKLELAIWYSTPPTRASCSHCMKPWHAVVLVRT